MRFKTIPLIDAEKSIGKEFPYRDILDDNMVIAGGAVRDWLGGIGVDEVSDIDVFVTRDTTVINNNHTRPTHRVSAIRKTPNEILLSFDFTANQCAVYLEDGKPMLMMGAETRADINDRVLIYTETCTGTHPIYHAKRIGKFIAKGYTICNDEVLKICCATVAHQADIPEDDYEDEGAF